jgi:hypothetical protein
MCFIVNSKDILTSSANYVDACKSCLDSCDSCVSGSGQGNVDKMMECMGKTIGKKKEGAVCRANCVDVCKH